MKRKFLTVCIGLLLLLSITGCSIAPVQTNTTAPKEQTAPVEPVKDYGVGETWTIDGQWTLTVDSVQETSERNPYAEKNPAAVYIVSFTYSNIGYQDANGIMDGLFFNLDESIVDCTGLMGYSYPGDLTDYPQETPVGATCKGQVCIGVDNAGFPVKLNVLQYDGNGQKQTATFVLN